MDKDSVVIAIDGYSSCGKSTLARALAKALELAYVDSGAMYRATTYYLLSNNFPIPSRDLTNNSAFDYSNVLDKIEIHFEYNPESGNSEVYLNGVNVEKEIRTMEVSRSVSLVSSVFEIRQKMVKLQKQMGEGGGLVMDGRDIGTVVFPDADLKIFMTADKTIRAQRRYIELKEKGKEVPMDEVVNNLKSRDYLDSTRDESPLRQADDAILLDNSHLNQEQQLIFVMEHVRKLPLFKNN